MVFPPLSCRTWSSYRRKLLSWASYLASSAPLPRGPIMLAGFSSANRSLRDSNLCRLVVEVLTNRAPKTQGRPMAEPDVAALSGLVIKREATLLTS